MNRFEKLKSFLFHHLWMITGIYMILFLWWGIGYTVNLWFAEHVLFSMDIFGRGWHMIQKSIIPMLAYAVLFTMFRLIVETKFFKIYRDKDGLHRKRIYFYYLFLTYVAYIMFTIVMVQMFLQFGELKKSCIAVSVIFSLTLLPNMAVTSKKRKQVIRWAKKQENLNKVVCAYVTSYDISDFQQDSSFYKKIMKKDVFSKLIEITEEIAIYETEETIVCPYWIYKDYLYQHIKNAKKRLLIVMDGTYMKKDDVLMGQIADEFLDNGFPVFKYNMFKSWSGNAISQRPVYSFSEEEKALELLTKKEVYGELSYFEDRSLMLPYSTVKEEYLKYHYLYKELTLLSGNELDTTAKFYHLLKVVEYVWHYRALYSLAMNENAVGIFKDQSIQSSMGLWNRLQDNIKVVYTDDEYVKAYCLIKKILSGTSCNVKKVRHQDICDILTQLRNRYVGHGTMAFSVSDELFDAIALLAYEIINLFCQETDCILREDMQVNGFAPYMKIKQENGALCQRLLSGYVKGDMDIYEYLDYRTGEVISNVQITYRLNYTEEVGK